MPSTPERTPALPGEPLRTLALLGLLGALLAWAFFGDVEVLRRAPPGPSASAKPASAFPGASSQRLFLSEGERLAAARQGLVPPDTRSIIATGEKLPFGAWRWDTAGVPAGRIAVRVDLARQLVSVFQGPHEIGTAVIVYGVDGKETPRGKLPILGKSRDYRSITYDAPMPYSLWLRDDGVALHGSSVEMGKATNGCIGVPVEFAERLFDVAAKGDVIEVLG